MQQLLVRRRVPSLRGYFIWGPYLPTDTVEMAEEHSRRFFVPNCAYYWTPSTTLARELGSALKIVRGRDAWDVYLIFKNGTIWGNAIPEPWYWQHQLDVLQGAPFDSRTFDAKIRQALTDVRS